jgi:DNA-binding MarR family transcriptional regulator
MTQKSDFVEDYLAYLLARASHLISSEFHAVVEASGMSLMEWRVMATLTDKQSMCINELASIVLAKQPTVTKLIGRMQVAGWVERCEAEHDKRQTLVSLTNEGRQKVNPLIVQAQSHEIQLTKEIGSAEMQHLKKVLKHLIASRARPEANLNTQSKTPHR